MISMFLLVLLLPPPPPPPSLRQPAVRTATAPSVAAAVKVDLVRMCTPSDTCLVEGARSRRSGRPGCGQAVRRPCGAERAVRPAPTLVAPLPMTDATSPETRRPVSVENTWTSSGWIWRWIVSPFMGGLLGVDAHA